MGKILKARRIHSTTKRVRQFKLPTLNFDCGDYTEMIDRSFEIVTESPLASNVSEQKLVAYINQTNIPVIESENYSGVTQAVERCIK